MDARDDSDDVKDKGRKQLREAMALFQEAYQHQMRGDLEEAIALYTRSIETFPTAEGYTFRGWTYSFLGRTEEAIAACQSSVGASATAGGWVPGPADG